MCLSLLTALFFFLRVWQKHRAYGCKKKKERKKRTVGRQRFVFEARSAKTHVWSLTLWCKAHISTSCFVCWAPSSPSSSSSSSSSPLAARRLDRLVSAAMWAVRFSSAGYSWVFDPADRGAPSTQKLKKKEKKKRTALPAELLLHL